VNGFKSKVIKVLLNYDLAVAEIYAHESELEFSDMGEPEIGPAHAIRGKFKNPCNIMTTGKTYHYLSFSFQTLPLPGDSGSPIVQNGKVVGILASIFYNNATGIAISLEAVKEH
jgi:SpoIVB peptidase S55.